MFSQKQQEALESAVIAPDYAKIAGDIFDTTYASTPKMSLHQINAFAETVRAYKAGADIHSAYIMGNASALSSATYPSGQVINYKPNAKVRARSRVRARS